MEHIVTGVILQRCEKSTKPPNVFSWNNGLFSSLNYFRCKKWGEMQIPPKKGFLTILFEQRWEKIKFPHHAIYCQISNQPTPSQQRSSYSFLWTKINQEAISKIDRTINHQMAHATSMTTGEMCPRSLHKSRPKQNEWMKVSYKATKLWEHLLLEWTWDRHEKAIDMSKSINFAKHDFDLGNNFSINIHRSQQ